MTEPTETPAAADYSEVTLGAVVRDRVTGFKGVVTAICHYLADCDRYLVSGGDAPAGKVPVEVWYSRGRIEVLGPPVQL